MNQMEVKRKRFSLIGSIILLLNTLVLNAVLGEHGMGYFAGVTEVFLFLIILTAYSLPEAMSKLMRTRIQKGQNKNAIRVFKAALWLGLFFSIAGSLIILTCADFILKILFGNSYGAFALRLLVPAYVLFVFVQVLRGFFQGMGSAVPTGISMIIESIVLFGTGILFCYLLGQYGEKAAALLHNEEFVAAYSGAGVSIGIIFAEIFSFLFLLFVYHTNKRNLRKNINRENFKMTEPVNELLYILITTMLPYIICLVCTRIVIIGGMSVYRYSSNVPVITGIGICGAFYGKYLAIILLIIMTIRLSIIATEGRIHTAFRKDEYKTARELVAAGSHWVIIQGAFWSVMIAILGNTLTDVFYKDNAGNAGHMLTYGSALILFMSIGKFFINILIAQGKRKKVILNMLCGVIIFFAYALISMKAFNAGIAGIIVGLCIYWLIITLGCGFFCIRSIKWKAEWIYMLVIPLICAALTGIIVMLLNKALISITGGGVSIIICFAAGAFGYYILLMALHGIRKEEFEIIPGGRFLYRIAEIIRFL